MNIIPTKFIFPLKKKKIFSKYYNAYFDNPRSKNELEMVKNFIKSSHENSNIFKIPYFDSDDIITWDTTLRDFFSIEEFKNHQPLVEISETYKKEQALDYIAKMWIVIRYDDENEHLKIKKQHTNEVRSLIILEDDNPIILNAEKVTDFSYFISLFLRKKDNLFHSFLLHSKFPGLNDLRDSHSSVSRTVMYFSILVSMLAQGESVSLDEKQDILFPYFYKRMKSIVKIFEKSVGNGYNNNKLLYVAKLLRSSSNDIFDEKLKIVTLVSILEMLLTHNPDYNRFNVEDSISKQFVLKTALFSYLEDKSLNLDFLSSKLKHYYSLRSMIAHGDIEKADNEIKKILKMFDFMSSEEIIDDLYSTITLVTNQFMKDTALMEFVKAK